MPSADDYRGLTIDQLQERLVVAETACLLMGWAAPILSNTPGADAATQAWMEWAHYVPDGFIHPSSHPDLDERRVYKLATERRDIRTRTLDTLAKIRELTSGV